MNPPIVRLFGLVVVLFGLLVAFTSRWTVFEAQALRDNPDNRRSLLAEQKIRRGTIRTADGRVIARSTRNADGVFERSYPTGARFGHPIGYAFTGIGRSGFEQDQNDVLTGVSEELVTIFESLVGRQREGSDIVTTLDGGAQQVAADALRGRRGAVVAMDARTGAIRAMASSPGFDPNRLDAPGALGRLSRDEQARPLVNRATFDLFPPGSTFKVVTAAAALDSGRFEPSSPVDGPAQKDVSGVPLSNFGDRDFGTIDLTTALTNSVNTVWAEVGVSLGRSTMDEYMRRFGFYARPPVDDYPERQVLISGVRKATGLRPVTSPSVDLGRVAIGQGDLQVTPLQMASVAATVANGGVRMEPFLTRRVVDPDGRTVSRADPERAERVISRRSAQELTTMMKSVVREGTGTQAALSGVEVAGKTGTAEVNTTGLNDPWFIGFSDRVVVAVVLDRVQGGQGGTVAAPVARSVLEALGR